MFGCVICSDSKTVVIDGGTTGDYTQLADIIKEKGRGFVDGWFFTHPHHDHIGAFVELIRNNPEIRIEKLFYNFPDIEILKKYGPKGVVHCYSGSVEMMKEILKIGMYIGMTGVVTFKNARKAVECMEEIPLDRLLIETDCPYLAPVPFRAKRCNSSMITFTAEKIAEIKGISRAEVLAATRENTNCLFNLNR